jgi:hypothetical protein
MNNGCLRLFTKGCESAIDPVAAIEQPTPHLQLRHQLVG